VKNVQTHRCNKTEMFVKNFNCLPRLFHWTPTLSPRFIVVQPTYAAMLLAV